ncbi:MAG: nitroreductase family protein [Christensenellales bacterium]
MVHIDEKACIGCGLCVAECLVSRVLVLQDDVARVLSDECMKCGHCLAVCPTAAVSMSAPYSMDEVVLFDQTPVVDAAQLMLMLKARRSIRHFKARDVEPQVIEQIIEAGRYSPTAVNAQNVRYIAVRDDVQMLERACNELYIKEREEARAAGLPVPYANLEIGDGFLFYGAPALILTVSPHDLNAGLASMSMELMAEALGLGVLYVGRFTRPVNQDEGIRNMLGIRPEENIVSCLAIGYPDVQFLRTAPRKAPEIVWR